MIYIVLREPTTSGGYVNRFAFSDQRTSLAIDCGGAWISPEAHITTISEMANKLDISQAKGGLGQGVEWSASLADWDGVARTSVGIFDGSARFYGWSVAVARSDSETATPDWIFDVDHWMVTDVSADGGTISITVGERWANDGRLLAFGQGGATVPLVVGGHDVWVKTSDIDARNRISYNRCDPAKSQGNPWEAIQFTYESYAASSKRPSETDPSLRVFSFQCINEEDAQRLWVKITQPASSSPAVGLFLCGKVYNCSVSRIEKSDGYKRVDIYCDQNFYDNESPDDVEIVLTAMGSPICAGASSLISFSSAGNTASPFGDVNVDGGVLSFSPKNKTKDGFVCYTIIPFEVAWTDEQVPHGATCRKYIEFQNTNVNQIVTDGGAVPNYTDVEANNFRPIGTVRNFFARAYTPTRQYFYLPLVAVIQESVSSKYTRFVSDVDATIAIYSQETNSLGWVSINCFPFSKDTHLTPGIPRDSTYRENVYRKGPGDYSAGNSFSSIDELNSKSSGVFGLKINPSDGCTGEIMFYCEIRAITIYGVSVIKFGDTYALVRTAAVPFPYASYPTNDRLDRAATTLIEQLAPYRGITISPAAPTFLPTAAQGGECLDASKTYRDNAVALLEETWQVLGVTAYGATPTDGQGLGEIPMPVSIVLGRFEDIVTEPVIEFCPVAGTLTKKAYIANVDQPFDATNPGKFYGGWGTAPAGADEPEGTDYGYLIWKQCCAAYLVHKVKRGATYQFNGIYDEAVVGQMWWESRRNGSRRIEWLCLQPRYLTYSVREAKPLAWSGSAVYIAGTLANYAGYDVSTWDNAGGDTLVVVDRSYDLLTGIGKYTVAIPPVPTVDAVAIYRDTLDAAHTTDRLVDTIDATAVTTKYTDTLEA